MIYLGREDLEGLVSMGEVMDEVEKAFLKHKEKKTVYPPKDQFTLPNDADRWWGFMPVYVEGMGVACKIVCDYVNNPKEGRPCIIATIVFADENTGEVKAVMEGNYLTAMRTGAVGGIAANYLSREDSKVAGIIGCGIQARTQLEALSLVRELREVRIYDQREDAMDAFMKDMSSLGIKIVKSGLKELHDADIIIAATASKEAVVHAKDLKAGTHVTSIGAHTPDARELEEGIVESAKVVIDSKDCMKSGDLKDYEGELSEIQEVIGGESIRKGPTDITLFKSVGTALQDVAIASLVYRKAIEKGKGKKLA